MPYPNAHILVRFIGHFGTSGSVDENWSVGWRFGIVGADVPSSPTALQTFVDSCSTAASTFHASANVYASTNCFLDELTGARIGPDGKYLPSTQDTVHKVLTPVAGVGTLVFPWNTAGVISLRTQYPRGYASNGRIYYPLISTTLTTTTGRMTTAQASARITAAKTLIDAMNVAAGIYATNMKLAVISAVGAGKTALVTSIRSDLRLDSIERREAKAPANWQNANIA